MSKPLVEFDGVVKRFGESIAVERLHLEIYAGEFLAIMGSSGCGKTTTLRMLAGLDTPSSGEIRLAGRRINELKPSQRDTPMVWQTLALFPFLSVIKNVEFGLKTRGIDAPTRRIKAMQWLERMEIAEFADRNIDQLSGGQRQRVALARALVTEPNILLLDEPLSALDANLVVRMQSVLSRLQKDLGITFVYVTHSQSEAFAMADRVVIMSKGIIEQVGQPKEVYRQPASRFVAEFVGTNNIITGCVTNQINDTMQISTDVGEITATSHHRFNIGEYVELVIGADVVKLSNQKPTNSANNFFSCQLVSEAFVGSVVTLLVETENGTEFRIQKQQRELDNLMTDQDQILWASWQANNVFVIPNHYSGDAS